MNIAYQSGHQFLDPNLATTSVTRAATSTVIHLFIQFAFHRRVLTPHFRIRRRLGTITRTLVFRLEVVFRYRTTKRTLPWVADALLLQRASVAR
jgi:hypothetical protein